MTKSQTNICKGVAALLLLWHHLFYEHPEYGMLVWKTSIYAKICVSIFLLLSGYGLYFSMRKLEASRTEETGEISFLWGFYKRRFTALMPRYWVICILGIAISILCCHIMPSDVFPNSTHPWGRVVLQILGLHMVKFAGYGYNPTWWFMTTIIILYVFYPLFHAMFLKFPILAWGILTVMSSFGKLSGWACPFVCGIFLARLTERYKSENTKFSCCLQILSGERVSRGGYFRVLTYIGLLALIGLFHYSFGIMAIVCFEALAIILLCCQLPLDNFAVRFLEYLGVHSYNIFLVHTLLNYWIIFKFIYKFRSAPLWALPLVLIGSLLASIGVNWIITKIVAVHARILR